MITLKELMLTSMSTMLVTYGFTKTKNETKDPNVVIIFTDDLGYGDLSCFNSESKIKTPNLDKLAKHGISFTDAHAASSVSTPSRYGLLTGEYSWKTRLKSSVLVGFSKTLIKEGQPTIASMLHSKGYTTACIGKWHLGMDFQTKNGKPLTKKQEHSGDNVDYTKSIKNSPITHGFDYYYGISASLDMPPFLMIENDRVEKLPNCKFLFSQFTRHDNDISANPFLRAGDAIFGEGPETFLPRLANKVNDKILAYSKESKPFFIYYPMPSPHAPIAPSSQFKGKSKIGAYGDYVMEIDYYVGKLIKQLKKTGQYKNTIIMFSSDNGPEFFAYNRYLRTGQSSTANLKGIKRDIWEGGHRVPLIISWPQGFKQYKIDKVSHPVCLSDIYATLADITGHELNNNEAADSYSLLPLISGNGKYERNYIIHHSCDGTFGVRKGDWVLIEFGLGDSNHEFTKSNLSTAKYYKKLGYTIPKYQPKGELYNLKNDLGEYHNVYNEHPELVKELDSYIQKSTRGYHTLREEYMKHQGEKILVR